MERVGGDNTSPPRGAATKVTPASLEMSPAPSQANPDAEVRVSAGAARIPRRELSAWDTRKKDLEM